MSLAGAYDGGDRGAEAPPFLEQAQALNPGNPLTFQVMFNHDLLLSRFDEAASDYSRYLIATGTDSTGGADIERRLRDPALRVAAFREIAKTPSSFGVIIHRILDGDDATVAYLAGLVKSPDRESIGGPALYMGLGPKLRANPRVQDILVQLRYPRPQDFGKHQ